MNLASTPDLPLSRSASRASGRSSKSRGSTLSRNQSLIKKNIELQDLKPADVLIERFVAWKAIVKQLCAYFEGIADIENNTAKEMTKLAGVIQVPFRAGNQFLGQGGLQDVYYDIRDKTRIIADHHADLGRTIDSSIVQHLQKLRVEIKAHIKNVQNDTGKLAAGVARERELSTKLVGELANAISTFKNTPMNVQARADPYVANAAVHRQLQRQVLEENLLQKSIIIMQQNSAHFEEGIVKAIQSAWSTYDEWQSRSATATQSSLRGLSQHMAAIQPDREWIQFSARSDHLLDPDTPLRDGELINYPMKDDPSVHPVHTGHLERKKRFSRSWSEAYFVLTPAGFLHEFPTSDPKERGGLQPVFSLFLPGCTLGPPSGNRAKAHKFHIEGTRDGTGVTATKSGSLKGLFLPLAGGSGAGTGGGGAKAWSFRARSREEMMEWWNDIRMLCARYLVVSEMGPREGPVESAVRGVGYATDEEEEISGDEEEEEDEEEAEVGVHDADVVRALGPVVHDDGSSVEEEEEPPLYTHPTGGSGKGYAGGVEIGENGYAIEKKRSPPPNGNNVAYHTQPSHSIFHPTPTIHSNEYNDVRSYRAERESGGDFPTNTNANGAEDQKLGRRLSKRQMEKSRSHSGEVGVDHGHEEEDELPPPIPMVGGGAVSHVDAGGRVQVEEEGDMYTSDEGEGAKGYDVAGGNGRGGKGAKHDGEEDKKEGGGSMIGNALSAVGSVGQSALGAVGVGHGA